MEGLSKLQRASRRLQLMLRIIPNEEFVLTRYHPHLVKPFHNDCNPIDSLISNSDLSQVFQ